MLYLYYIIDIACMYLNILVSLNYLKNAGTGKKEINCLYMYVVAYILFIIQIWQMCTNLTNLQKTQSNVRLLHILTL